MNCVDTSTPLLIDEPSVEQSVEILTELRLDFQNHYGGLEISDDVLAAIVQLVHRYLDEERLPGKAVQLLDRVCARAIIASLTEGKELPSPLNKELVRQVLAEKTGNPSVHLDLEE